MKMLNKYFITILLVAVMCSPALAEKSRRQSETEREIIKSVAAIGQTGKEAGKTIGQYLKEIGMRTGIVFKDMARTLRDTAQKELR